MKYLLDTHTILWYAQGSSELSENARSLMEGEFCLYSMASLWEIAIKQKLGKLDGTLTASELDELCKNAGFRQIPINAFQVEITKTLDFIHRDPFDRLLVATAQLENLILILQDVIVELMCSKYTTK